MDVTRTVQDIEDLTGLGNGTKQRVIAAGALLLFVKPHGGPFGPPTGALHRAVEVQRSVILATDQASAAVINPTGRIQARVAYAIVVTRRAVFCPE